jgi:cysteine-rich repeat protein
MRETATFCVCAIALIAGLACARTTCDELRTCDAHIDSGVCTDVALGCACNTFGALACNGAALRLTLICREGIWQEHTTCSSEQNCDQTSGTCAPIVSQCAGYTGGFTYCEGQDVLRTCGIDLVSASTTTCVGVCVPGSPAQCAAPRCGDGKVESDEECDDGNSTPVDGCENNCVMSKVLGLAAGTNHACALLQGGYVRCWGANDTGQLGLGHTLFEGDKFPYQLTDASGNPAGPIDLGGSATAIAARQDVTCALLTDGSVRCWGFNGNGELGLGHTNALPISTPRMLGALDLGGKATAISLGTNFACAVLEDGTVRCWGANDTGQLGLGDLTKTLVSRTQRPSQYGPISFASRAIAISCGSSHSCALLQGGTVQSWGNNPRGQLGLGTIVPPNDIVGDSELPPTVPAVQLGTTANAIAAGASHSCARLDNGRIVCWGFNSFGQLGVGNALNVADDEAAFPAGQVGLSSVTSVFAGSQHTCAILPAPGGLRCWGLNSAAQLGYPDLTNRGDSGTTTPLNLPNLPIAATSVSIGGNFTCALLTTGEVRCWGLNNKGQLGLGMVSTTPVYVGGDADQTPDKLPSVQIFPP